MNKKEKLDIKLKIFKAILSDKKNVVSVLKEKQHSQNDIIEDRLKEKRKSN